MFRSSTLRNCFYGILILCLCCVCFDEALAKKKKRRGPRRYSGPPPTHPVVLWSRTLSESQDLEERKVAAFKLSQYSQTIYQEAIVNNLIKCMKDTDVHLKVLCAKAMGKAGSQAQTEWVRKNLIETYQNDPSLRNTIVRAFITRKDSSEKVHDLFLKSLKDSKDPEETLTLLSYFEEFGEGDKKFVSTLAEIYKNTDNIKVKRSAVEALATNGQGQSEIIDIMAGCVDSKDTPLALNCISGLQVQARTDSRTWPAVEKTIESDDTDVLLATLDLIITLPESRQTKIAKRLVEIIEDNEDSEIQEKAVLAVGVCGDHSEPIVKALQSLFEEKETHEAVRVAVALVMGRQADSFPEKPKGALSKCVMETKSQSLKTACQLGLRELEQRKALVDKAAVSAAARETADNAEKARLAEEKSLSAPNAKEAQ